MDLHKLWPSCRRGLSSWQKNHGHKAGFCHLGGSPNFCGHDGQEKLAPGDGAPIPGRMPWPSEKNRRTLGQ